MLLPAVYSLRLLLLFPCVRCEQDNGVYIYLCLFTCPLISDKPITSVAKHCHLSLPARDLCNPPHKSHNDHHLSALNINLLRSASLFFILHHFDSKCSLSFISFLTNWQLKNYTNMTLCTRSYIYSR